MIDSELQEEIQSELMRLFQAAGIFHYDANGVEKTGISFANFAGTEIQSELIDKPNVTGPLPFTSSFGY